MLDIYSKDSLYGRSGVFEKIDEIDAALEDNENELDEGKRREMRVKLLYEKMLRSMWLQYIPGRN